MHTHTPNSLQKHFLVHSNRPIRGEKHVNAIISKRVHIYIWEWCKANKWRHWLFNKSSNSAISITIRATNNYLGFYTENERWGETEKSHILIKQFYRTLKVYSRFMLFTVLQPVWAFAISFSLMNRATFFSLCPTLTLRWQHDEIWTQFGYKYFRMIYLFDFHSVRFTRFTRFYSPREFIVSGREEKIEVNFTPP